MTCCDHHEAYDERIAIMICEGLDEAQATYQAMIDYGNKCYGCGQENLPCES